jgi:ATP:ADP antiporter, AAA family
MGRNGGERTCRTGRYVENVTGKYNAMSNNTRIKEILHFLEIMPGEGKMAALALGATFFHGVSNIYLFSTSHALFLAYFQAEDLPFTYIGGALTVLLVGAAFSALQHRIPQLQLVVGTLCALMVTMLIAWAWLVLGDPQWPSAFLAVWTVSYSTLTYMALWGLFGRVFDTRQAKRLFGLIGAGEFAADILSGFVTPLMVGLMGSIHLLLVAALGLFLMTLFTVLLARVDHAQIPGGVSREPEPTSLPLMKLFKERYPLLLHLLWGLSLMTFYMMDTAFSNQLEKHYADSVDDMTSFLGVFFAVGSAVNMFIETFLTGRVLNKIGILKSLFILPVGVLLGCLSLFASQLFVPRIGLVVFVLAVGTKMYDYVMRNAIHDPAFQVLYQPMPLSKRFAVQSSVLTRAESTAALIGGGALLLGRLYFDIDAVNIAWIISIIVAIQVGFTFLVRGQYLQSLMDALKTRRLDLEKTTLYDRPGIDMLMGWLDSRHPGEVIYSMKLLEKNAPGKLGDRLADLLTHSSTEVRACALEGIERLGPSGAREKVLGLINDSTLPGEVRAKAVLAYCALDEAGAAELGQDLLQSDDPAVCRAAMTGLLRYCGIEGVLVAGDRFMEMLHSDNAALRVDAAGIIGESKVKAFYRPIRNLLQDTAEPVRRAALLAAEKLAHPRLIPALIPHLSSPKNRFPAIRAIAAVGDQALPELSLALPMPDQRPDVVQGILRAVSRIPSDKATEFLLEHLFYPDADARRLILSKLQARGYQAQSDEEKTLLRGLLNQEGAFCTWVLNCLNTLSEEGDLEPLKSALDETFRSGLLRILAAVSLLCPPHAIQAVQHNLDKEKDKRANALEMLDSLITEEVRRIIHPLVDDLSPSQRLEQLGRMFPVQTLDVRETLSAIVRKERGWLGSWPRALALYAMGRRKDPVFMEVVKQMQPSPVPIIRETAGWILEQMQGR